MDEVEEKVVIYTLKSQGWSWVDENEECCVDKTGKLPAARL
jgi:hypothetical protein